jgi:hypothetical protein
MSSLAIPWKKPWFFACIGFAFVGVLMLAACIRHNGRYDWHPLHIHLSLEADAVGSAEFVAELDAVYEIELQFERHLPAEIEYQSLLVWDNAPVDLTWSVDNDFGKIARGDSLEYLYLSLKSYKRRVWNYLLNAPGHFEIMPGKICRGIGAFHAVKGERYTLEVRTREVPDEVDATHPAVAVRINRQFAVRHYQEKVAMGAAGLIALGAVGPCGALWLLSLWRERRSNK